MPAPNPRAPAARSRGFNLFRILGVQISVDYSWFVVFLLVLAALGGVHFPQVYPDQPAVYRWLAGFTATMLFFASVLAHELSHSLVARALGLRVLGITLFVFGGVSRLASEPPEPWTEIKVAAAGPLMSFFLGGFFFTFHLLAGAAPGISPLVVETLQYLGVVNVALAIFNLIPGFPLDGGRVLRAVIWLNTGSMLRATRMASRWGIGVALALMLVGGAQVLLSGNLGGLWLILIGLFLRTAAKASGRDVELRTLLEGACVGDLMLKDLETLPAGATVEAATGFFLARGYRAFPVQEGGEIRGLVTLAQLGEVSPPERDSRRIGEIMLEAGAMPRLAPGDPALRAVEELSGSGHDALLVYEDRTAVGMITRGAVERLLRARTALGNQGGGS